jgi:hypothetical protein
MNPETGSVPTFKVTLEGRDTIRNHAAQIVWYILTDVDDPGVAALLGLNLSAKLTNAGPGARTANFNSNGDLIFNAGRVDFSPNRTLVAGPSSAPFPPVVAEPGSIGDANLVQSFVFSTRAESFTTLRSSRLA